MSFFKKIFCEDDRKKAKKLGSDILELNKQKEDLKYQLKVSKMAIVSQEKNQNSVNYDKAVKITHQKIASLIGDSMSKLDPHYYGIDKEDVEAILLAHTYISDAKYVATTHDCDDYAQALHGVFSQWRLSRFAFGFARSRTHAFNFFVDRNSKVWVVEPQSMRVFEYSQDALKKEKLDYNINGWVI